MVADEEVRVRAEAWNNAFGYIKPTAVATAVELGLPDILENHDGPMSLLELSAATDCPAEPLHRLMRFLVFHGIFKKTAKPPLSNEAVYYARTALSRLFTRDELGDFMLLQTGPLSQHPAGLTASSLRTGKPQFIRSVNGEDSWTDPVNGYHMKVFSDAMAAHARETTAAIVRYCPAAFEGIGTVVDVGGRHGVALEKLVAAFPWVRGISFDLPEIVAKAPPRPGIEFVGGSFFESVPKGDLVLLMWILHDWSDESCIEIMKKCKEAIPTSGKVMIVDAIVDEDGEGDDFAGARLSLDLIMMAVLARGKERTYREWEYLLREAGFTKFVVKNINTVEFVIEAYP
uniref:Flavonoid 4'-O-methyltransferase 4 n=1 Tax=Mentha piperita TaxID=34256 RepID=OMT4_MENPI|nr:RecName: Full=Flavonoid 4'-O-methyltransferase 4; Short=MpOMT4; AltName: Full=7,8,4'-trihydroxy-flavone 4'-O-methyltransferase; AltName: Full=Apigenin 4'-O-methyltransferase; AltName: Full=Isorhamnetin 4'-O-methyltransferase; AltName: Full=Kaempferol 4'-O-methyltransferase; AltName: Full=Naringenin 4'-O-methyltransferase; AltName: Full=Scutellarein 4'-O-methyltransferase; AltName: Full=Taxifolin 4'-O-methyltransferase [Mentha x piperita]AAR09602.1 flavonoid 4'-O-methyltransferase [Mentha x pipe